MKKILRMFLFSTGVAFLAASCDESEWEVQNLFPEEYHKILYILDSGEKEVTLYKTGLNTEFTYSVVKAGSEPTETAAANTKVISQAEIDTKYSNIQGTPYWVIPEGSYEIKTKELSFSSSDAFKYISFTINPEAVETFMIKQKELDPENAQYMKFVLPIIIEGVTAKDSVNSMKNFVMLNITNVVTPTVGFVDIGIQEQYIGQADASIEIPINLDVENQWDFTSRVVIDDDYIKAYNAEHGTSYLPFPASAIEVPEMIQFTPGNQTTMNVQVKYSNLPKADMANYMLAIKLEKGEQFDISETKNYYVLATTYRMNDRSNWKWNVNSESSQEGNNGWLTCVYDGNTNSYWHSNYGNGSGVVNLLPYTFTIDMKEVRTVCSFALWSRQSANNSDLKEGYFEASTDNENWTKIGTWTMGKGELYEHLYDVSPTQARYLRVWITASHRGQNAGVGEIYVFGY